MAPLTGNTKREAEQHLDSAELHLRELRALVIPSGPATEAKTVTSADWDYESVAAETFGRWVLDLLGLGASAPSEAAATARGQLVAALSKRVDPKDLLSAPLAGSDLRFVDVFAGDDLVHVPDEELGVKPISYEL